MMQANLSVVSILKPSHFACVGVITGFLTLCRAVIALCTPAGLLTLMNDLEVFSGVGAADENMDMRVCFVPVQGRNPHLPRKLILREDDHVFCPVSDIVNHPLTFRLGQCVYII